MTITRDLLGECGGHSDAAIRPPVYVQVMGKSTVNVLGLEEMLENMRARATSSNVPPERIPTI